MKNIQNKGTLWHYPVFTQTAVGREPVPGEGLSLSKLHHQRHRRKTGGLRRTSWLGECLCPELCSRTGVLRKICISLFLFESLQENFHIVWGSLPPTAGGYLPHGLNHWVKISNHALCLGPQPRWWPHPSPLGPSSCGTDLPFSPSPWWLAGAKTACVHVCSHTKAFSQMPMRLPSWMAELSPKPYTKSDVYSSQACLLLRNPLGGLLEPVSDASAGVKMEGFCPGTGSIQQGLRRRQGSSMVCGIESAIRGVQCTEQQPPRGRGGGTMSRPFVQQPHVRGCNTGIFRLWIPCLCAC